MNVLNIAILSPDPGYGVVLEKQIESLPGLQLHNIKSLLEFKAIDLNSICFSGVIIDARYLLRLSLEEEQILRVLTMRKMPRIDLTIPARVFDVNAQMIFKKRWALFTSESKKFEPRGLRAHPRKHLVLKAEICPGSIWSPAASEKVFTADVSEGGCFAVTCADIGDSTRVLIRLGGLEEPYDCAVAWKRKWEGMSSNFPGMGLRFDKFSVSGKAQLLQLLSSV